MKQIHLAPLLLRARLAAVRVGPAACLAAVLCLVGAAGLAWLAPQRAKLQAERQRLEQQRQRPAAPGTLVSAPPPSANENMAGFYAALGERRHAEQHVKVLFGLAAKAGLSLRQGEYKFGYDKASRVSTYQIVLPVKGGYNAIWQFSLEALRALPFASLDDIAFRRENINDAQVEARVRLTLYLQDAAAVSSSSAAVQP
ncbi:hypothetical protein [Pseudoduganella namucuonensis]|nr:hypothetical protein [Pseudoduganella namucuonensis]